MNISQVNGPVLRLDGVRVVTGLSKTAVYDKACKTSPYYDPTFPARFKIGRRSVGWDASEISAWVQKKKDERL